MTESRTLRLGPCICGACTECERSRELSEEKAKHFTTALYLAQALSDLASARAELAYRTEERDKALAHERFAEKGRHRLEQELAASQERVRELETVRAENNSDLGVLRKQRDARIAELGQHFEQLNEDRNRERTRAETAERELSALVDQHEQQRHRRKSAESRAREGASRINRDAVRISTLETDLSEARSVIEAVREIIWNRDNYDTIMREKLSALLAPPTAEGKTDV